MIFNKKLWMILSVVCSTLLALAIMVTYVCNTYATMINSTLGLKNYKLLKVEGEEIDSEYYPYGYSDFERLKEDYNEICREVESEGLVLLRNDNNVLPLGTDIKVSLFGTGSAYFNCSEQGGRTSSDKEKYPSLKEAMESAETGNVKVNPDLWDFYTTGAGSSYGGSKSVVNNIQTYFINEVPWDKYPVELRNGFGSYGDAAIVTLTRDSGEGADLNAAGSDGKDGNYLALSPEEYELLQKLTEYRNNGVFSSIIVILNGATPLQLDFMYDDTIKIDGCMWVGNVGSAGIYAVADAIVGNINPSGRLSDTFVQNNFSSPAMASWILNDNRSFSQTYSNPNGYSLDTSTQLHYGVYVEGIYSGYRYYETRYADVVTDRARVGDFDYSKEMAFTFGSGLSYTQFEYSDFTVTENNDEDAFEISVKVTNVGAFDGKEVVQVYLQKPYTQYAIENSMEVSAIELVGFAKTDVLDAYDGEEIVTVTVEKSQLTSYDAYGAGTYVLDEGTYSFAVGYNAHDALNNILTSNGYTNYDGMDYAGNENLAFNYEVSSRDVTTYAVSAETGKTIANRLDFADMNRYSGRGDNKVKYVSRNDWAGTWPTAATQFTVNQQINADLQSNKPVSDEGYELPVYGKDSGLTVAMLRSTEENPIPYDDPRWDDLLDQMTFQEQNELIVKGNVTTEFVDSVQYPGTTGTDCPTAIRPGPKNVTNVRFPCEGIWASTFNTELVRKVGEFMANDARHIGADAAWIPGMNIHRTPYGGRAHEYFSEDPYLTGRMAETEIKGIQSKGVIAYPKHFIFNESEANRNGIGIWLNEQAAREIMLAPWKYAASAKRGNAHAMMSSFNRVGCIWSSASHGLMTEILRDEFGFEGFVITDMAEGNGTSFMTVLDGIVAGTDLWFSSSLTTHNFTPYEKNACVAQNMRNAAHRILYNVANYSAAMNGWSADTRAVPIMVWWQIVCVIFLAVSAVATAASLALLTLSYIIDIKKGRKSD